MICVISSNFLTTKIGYCSFLPFHSVNSQWHAEFFPKRKKGDEAKENKKWRRRTKSRFAPWLILNSIATVKDPTIEIIRKRSLRCDFAPILLAMPNGFRFSFLHTYVLNGPFPILSIDKLLFSLFFPKFFNKIPKIANRTASWKIFVQKKTRLSLETREYRATCATRTHRTSLRFGSHHRIWISHKFQTKSISLQFLRNFVFLPQLSHATIHFFSKWRGAESHATANVWPEWKMTTCNLTMCHRHPTRKAANLWSVEENHLIYWRKNCNDKLRTRTDAQSAEPLHVQ